MSHDDSWISPLSNNITACYGKLVVEEETGSLHGGFVLGLKHRKYGGRRNERIGYHDS